jgi:hypothetical protein
VIIPRTARIVFRTAKEGYSAGERRLRGVIQLLMPATTPAALDRNGGRFQSERMAAFNRNPRPQLSESAAASDLAATAMSRMSIQVPQWEHAMVAPESDLRVRHATWHAQSLCEGLAVAWESLVCDARDPFMLGRQGY